jgi:hypothetical protein
MIRLLMRAIQILVPVAFYFLWLRFKRQKEAAKTAEDAAAAARAERELTLAVIVLVVMTIGSFAALRLEGDSAAPSKTYVPARSEHGEIVPGSFK